MVLRSRGADREGSFSGNRVERAIIDIGSNTVRLVIYGGSPRAPVTVFNEKVAARLGREIAQTGRLADEAIDMAMRGLRRFALLLRQLKIDKVDVVATAASRDATNGPEFLAGVRDLGFEPRLLAGEDEARLSAMGVIGAFPDATGVVADLGGGSLEMIRIGDRRADDGISLPLGTLRLPDHRGDDDEETIANLVNMMRDAPETHSGSGTLYLVGGTWRAMAVVAMGARRYPLSDPHGFELPAADVLELTRQLAKFSPEDIRRNPRITSMRASYLPDAGLLLQALLRRLSPGRVVFSSWGLREGILYNELEDYVRAQDPLLSGVAEFAQLRGTPPMLATRVAAWTVGALKTGSQGSERLRLAATMLALASMQIEPNLRTELAVDWALQKRWLDVSAAGRAMMAAALAANKNEVDLPDALRELASEEQLEEAVCWGLAIRLCRRLGGRSSKLFNVSSIAIEDDSLVLTIDEHFSDLYGLPNEKDLDLLANRLGLHPQVRFAPAGGDGPDDL